MEDCSFVLANSNKLAKGNVHFFCRTMPPFTSYNTLKRKVNKFYESNQAMFVYKTICN